MENKRHLLEVKHKLMISSVLAVLWLTFSIYIGLPWIKDLSLNIGLLPALLIITGIAFIPGLANAFLIFSILLDRRPSYTNLDNYPDITILIAAFNEQDCIEKTLDSICEQKYPANISVLVCDDGSSDHTRHIVNNYKIKGNCLMKVKCYNNGKNLRKAMSLNKLLSHCETQYCITIDADTSLYKDALVNIVSNIVKGPENTAAVAGTVLVRNSRENFITKVQEWDYFLGIAAIKRVQSLYQGTLVAQGAFSIYLTKAIRELGGWEDTVGEDIVLTWGLRDLNYRVSYAENAIAFTNIPNTYREFYFQRKRWARGLIEAFKRHPKNIFRLNKTSPFIWLNLTFPFNDIIFLFVFVPGIFAAVFFKIYAIVGLMTLLLLPLALTINSIMFSKHIRTFALLGLRVRKNRLGFMFYMLIYQMLMAPASVSGYMAEFLKLSKSWGPGENKCIKNR